MARQAPGRVRLSPSSSQGVAASETTLPPLYRPPTGPPIPTDLALFRTTVVESAISNDATSLTNEPSVSSNGTPVFPYNIGRAFYGNPTGASIASITESVVTNFVGGSGSALKLQPPSVQSGSGNVTLTWSSVEGGSYVVSSTADLQNWTTNILPTVTATNVSTSVTHSGAAKTNSARIYRVIRTALATAAN